MSEYGFTKKDWALFRIIQPANKKSILKLKKVKKLYRLKIRH